jgi:hypothetical protein
MDNMRVRVRDCVEKQLYTTAIFFAEKLVTFTNGGCRIRKSAYEPDVAAAIGVMRRGGR